MMWKRQRHAPPKTIGEIEIAPMVNQAAMKDAERTKARLSRVAVKVARTHEFLMHDGAANRYTERWERALRRGR